MDRIVILSWVICHLSVVSGQWSVVSGQLCPRNANLLIGCFCVLGNQENWRSRGAWSEIHIFWATGNAPEPGQRQENDQCLMIDDPLLLGV